MIDFFLAIDIGTSRLKGTIINSYGCIHAECESLRKNSSRKNGVHEDNAEVDWWFEFIKISNELLQRAKTRKISGICVSGMWPNFLLTDRKNNPLHPAILYDDVRSEKICQDLKTIIGTNIYGYEIIPRLLWLRNEHPDILKKARHFLTTHSFIVNKLTDVHSIDSHTALSLGNVFNSSSFKWEASYFKEFQLDFEIMPDVSPITQVAGHLTKNAAGLLGLSAGIPVLTGCGDTFASLLGSGPSQNKDAFIYLGTGGILLELTKNIDYIFNANSYSDGDEGINWILSLTRSGEKILNIIKLLGNISNINENTTLYSYMEEFASKSVPGSNGIKYIFETEQPSYSIFGTEISSALVGIKSDTNAGQIYRALLEGISFRLRSALINRKPENSVFVSGGNIRSTLFRKILANVLNTNIVYNETSQGALGGALLAAHSLNSLDLTNHIDSIRKSMYITHPNISLVKKYNDLYLEHLKVSSKLS